MGEVDKDRFYQVLEKVVGQAVDPICQELAKVSAQRDELLAAARLHKAWSDSEDAGPDYGGQSRDTHPDGEAIWRKWWEGQLDLCARAQEATDKAIQNAEAGDEG